MRTVRTCVTVSSLVLLCATGCGKSSSTLSPDGGSGTLEVTLSAPDAGSSPAVTVTGPGGYSKALSASETLTGLAAGSYTVTAQSLRVTGPQVSTVYDPSVSGSPATVSDGATAQVQVQYNPRPGTGQFWYSNTSTSVLSALTPPQLGASGSPSPAVGLGLTANSYPSFLSFDRQGSLWVAAEPPASTQIWRFSPSQLAASGNPTPAATLSFSTTSYSVKGLAFDHGGNLWVLAGGKLLQFAASSLSGAGSLPFAPRVSVTVPAPTGFAPWAMVMDATGNVWLSEPTNPPSAGGIVFELTAAQLAASGSPTAGLTLNTSDLTYPDQMAFDAQGNLWVANQGVSGVPGSLVRFDATALTGTTTVTSSNFVLHSAAFSGLGAGLQSIGFDESGDVWVVVNQGSIFEFPKSTLVGTGTVTAAVPSVTLTTSGTGLAGLAFDPPPANLPLAP
jgi:streptogramin lyase